MNMSRVSFGVLSLFFLLIASCHHHTSLSGETAFEFATAPIDRIELLTLESFPVQVHVRIKGYLHDSCTSLDHISQTWSDTLFQVSVITKRPVGLDCAEVVTWFEETAALEVEGLPAGTYIVDVNGVRDTFTLDVENRL